MYRHLFIWCCKGFFRDENRDELYRVLDVGRGATPDEIKRAYRNKSLQMHPDKLNQRGREVTEEDRANFQNMKAAYDVLKDPQKREVYDELGETGMTLMEDPLAAREKMLKNFLKMSTRDRLRLVIFVLLIVAAVLIWPILFCIKLDGNLDSSWVALWTPLWIYNAAGLFFHLYRVSVDDNEPPDGMEEKGMETFTRAMKVLGLVRWTLLVVFQVFLTMRLDEDINWRWAVVGIPLLVWMALQLLVDLYQARKPIPRDRTEETVLDEEGDFIPDTEKREYAEMRRFEAQTALPKDVMWILQIVFLMIKLDEQVDWNWWVVFLPTWMVVIGQVMTVIFACNYQRSVAAGMEGRNEEDISEEEKFRSMKAAQMVARASMSFCCWNFTFVTIILAVNAIAGADYSAFVIFIPQFTIAWLVVCCLSCFICCVRGDIDDFENPNGVNAEQGGAQGATGGQPLQQQSYGTYNPPEVGGTGGGRDASAFATDAIVIPLPPPNAPSAPSAQNPVLPAPPQQPRPVPRSTPDPENQSDGGID